MNKVNFLAAAGNVFLLCLSEEAEECCGIASEACDCSPEKETESSLLYLYCSSNCCQPYLENHSFLGAMGESSINL